jgi:hypothetical protein
MYTTKPLRMMMDRFPDEIQLSIWRHVVPDPRKVGRGIIPVIVNWDLKDARAIVPDERLFKAAHKRVLDKQATFIKLRTAKRERTSDPLSDSEKTTEFWEENNSQMIDNRSKILGMLEWSDYSKMAVLERYSFEPDMTKPPLEIKRAGSIWKANDTVVSWPWDL